MKQYRLYLIQRGAGGIDYRYYHGRILSAEDLVVAKLKDPHIKYSEILVTESDPIPTDGIFIGKGSKNEL